jgi:hypothetical protein
MAIKQLKNPLTEEYKLLKEYILGTQIAWHWKPDSVPQSTKESIEFLSHSVIERTSPSDGHLYPKTYSSTVDACENVLFQIFSYNNILPNTVLRINFNLTLQSCKKTSTSPHTDHLYEHKNLIIYLNESDGETVICDESDNDLEFSEPEEDKIIIFSGRHYHFLPMKSRRRVVMVCTFI